jgi:DNA-binding MarR family transcriptional regulator
VTDTQLKLDSFMPYRLSVVSNLVSERIADAYRALFGLSVPEWRVVAVLAEADGLSQMAIGERTRMDKVSVSRAARALEGRGLVARPTNRSDGRARVLSLTPAGEALYALIVPRAKAMEAEILKGLDAAEMELLAELLGRIETQLLSKGSGA